MTGSSSTRLRSPSVPMRGGLAVLLAVLVNVVIVLGVDALGIGTGFRALTIPPVAFLSAVGAGGAALVYWLLARRVSDSSRTFVLLAIGVLLISFLPDIALLGIDPTATPLGVIVLMAMHVVVAAVSVGLLVYWKADG